MISKWYINIWFSNKTHMILQKRDENVWHLIRHWKKIDYTNRFLITLWFGKANIKSAFIEPHQSNTKFCISYSKNNCTQFNLSSTWFIIILFGRKVHSWPHSVVEKWRKICSIWCNEIMLRNNNFFNYNT